MQNTIVENQELIILSSEVTNATKCRVVKVSSDDEFVVELQTNEIYEDGEEVELFTVSGGGILYFKTNLLAISDKELTVKIPVSYGVIQRREYTRVEIDKRILIKSGNRNIRALIYDISAGGMKITTDCEMDCKTDYNVDIKLEENLAITASFQPVRIKAQDDGHFIVSGKFSLITNVDRVALAQYCLRKQTENQNK